MPRIEKIIRVFLASPSDLAPERDRVSEVVDELNKSLSLSTRCRLALIRWEDDVNPGVGRDAQDVVNQSVPSDFEIFVGLMWGRYGTKTERAGSGTEEEFSRARERYRNDPDSVKILFYFKDAPIAPDDIDPQQIAEVKRFRKEMESDGVLYKVFKKTEEFEQFLRIHLTRQVQQFAVPLRTSDSAESSVETSEAAEENEELGLLDYLDQLNGVFENRYERSRERKPWESRLIPRSQIDNLRYSFTRPEFLHPLIIRKLVGQVSDPYEVATGVDVAITNQSERSFGTFKVCTQRGRILVSWRAWEQSILLDSVERRSSYSYSHIATSESGIELVQCSDCGGGSGVFGSVAFFSWERDSGFNSCIDAPDTSSERIILKSLGSIPLGDRYDGEITYEDGVLDIGPDEGWFRLGDATIRRIPVP